MRLAKYKSCCHFRGKNKSYITYTLSNTSKLWKSLIFLSSSSNQYQFKFTRKGGKNMISLMLKIKSDLLCRNILIKFFVHMMKWHGIAQSVQRLDTGWTVRDQIPHVQTDSGAHPASCTMGTAFFLRVKRSVSGADHPPLLAPRSRKE
jgi:hypothetical protein